MNFCEHCNTYEFAAAKALDEFPTNLQGDPNCSILVVSMSALPNLACDAIAKSAKRLGFGSKSCAWATLEGNAMQPSMRPEEGQAVERSRPESELSSISQDVKPAKDASSLTPDKLSSIVEAIDPICVIATDQASADTLGVPVEALSQKHGRSVAAFEDFPSMLESQEGKQRAWAILRQLSVS